MKRSLEPAEDELSVAAKGRVVEFCNTNARERVAGWGAPDGGRALAEPRDILYIFDPAAGAANRWTLVRDEMVLNEEIQLLGLLRPHSSTAPDKNFFVVRRVLPTQTQVVKLLNK